MANTLKINPKDNVVVALSDLPAGARLSWDGNMDGELAALEDIPFGHKVAIVPIVKGAPVIKYGANIGVATQDIAPGQHVHSHNLATVRGAARA
ncbi:MAG: UxaA family hydrolase [Chloroflexi bacterium]|nr:UxaA family hydrolase [Chloroflexota bacterium]